MPHYMGSLQGSALHKGSLRGSILQKGSLLRSVHQSSLLGPDGKQPEPHPICLSLTTALSSLCLHVGNRENGGPSLVDCLEEKACESLANM